MRSWAAYARFTPEGIAVAVMEGRRAVSLAPDYAVARGTLAMGLAILYQQRGFRDRELIDEAIEHAEKALELNSNHASVLFQVVNTLVNAGRWAEALPLAERAVDLNPSLVDARQALASTLSHFERYEEALVHLAEGDRIAPRAFQQVISLGHRCWALYGLGRIEAALDVVSDYVRLHPIGKYPLMSRAVFLQALGRIDEAQDMMLRTRKTAPGEPLEFWIGFARGSYMSETMFRSYSQHFIDAWKATPEEPHA